MPVTLVTGPANAAKAGAVLDGVRAALPREPVLVVPTAADADRYRRELAEAGLVFGVEVTTFPRLVRDLARRTGVRARRLGPVAVERVVRAVVREASLRRLAASAAAPGFAAAAGALFAELQRSLVTPERLAAALATWASGSDRAAYAREVAGLYAAYRERLAALGAADGDGFAWAALDALRADPAAWAERPVFFYGFDDLTRLQLDAVETLARHAPVWVALPYEPGRAAFAGRAGTVEALRPLAERHVPLPDRSEHYAAPARPALHHLERFLFEAGAPRVPPNGAVRLLEAAGERAEAELVGAEVLELMRDGVAPADIAVLVRGGAAAGDVLAQVLEGYGVPVARDVRVPLARTRLGAGLLAFARAALGGSADDVVRWLRTPGKLDSPDRVDRLDAAVRRFEAATAGEARRLWERDGGEPFDALEALAAAAAAGPVALLDALVAEAEAIWTAPHRRRAAVLSPDDEADARVEGALRAAAGELRTLTAADPELLRDPADVLEALGAVRVDERPRGGVLLADPLAIRARRFRAVFVCGLQDGEFPRRPVPEPFFDDDDRRAIARASGLLLPLREDVLARERYLFYASVSRPEEVLFLSWRSSDEEGNPLQASPFVDDVRALYADELSSQRGRRLLADVTWPPRDAPTPLELRRSLAVASGGADPPPLAAPATAAVLARLAARERESARGLESFAACGVRWLVETLLRPERVDPDPELLRRGALAHALLERTLALLRERSGSARLEAGREQAALEALDAAIAERTQAAVGARARAGLRGLRAELARVLREECEHGGGLEPLLLEWSFGGDGDAHGALELGDGVRVGGRVDRVDAGPGGTAVVRDYKARTVHPLARWEQDGRLQVGLYALAVRELLGREPVGALYQPTLGPDLRARGAVLAGTPGRYVARDEVDASAFEDALAAARERALEAARQIRAGRIRPCPRTCTPRGCAYPAICRAGHDELEEDDE